jgi:hypothetical protein
VTAPQALLEAAARCYLRGGAPEGACSCFDRIGAWAEAASLHESAGRSREAADRYEKAQRWIDAARCHRASGDFAGEARCLERAGARIRAAWVLAHDLGQAHQAQVLVQDAWNEDDTIILGEDAVVRARCLVVLGERRAAALMLRAALRLIREHTGFVPLWLSGWALAVAEALRRPDLAAEILTMEQSPEAEPLWDAWAQRTFGEAVAPPVRLDQEPPAEVEGSQESETHE